MTYPSRYLVLSLFFSFTACSDDAPPPAAGAAGSPTAGSGGSSAGSGGAADAGAGGSPAGAAGVAGTGGMAGAAGAPRTVKTTCNDADQVDAGTPTKTASVVSCTLPDVLQGTSSTPAIISTAVGEADDGTMHAFVAVGFADDALHHFTVDTSAGCSLVEDTSWKPPTKVLCERFYPDNAGAVWCTGASPKDALGTRVITRIWPTTGPLCTTPGQYNGEIGVDVASGTVLIGEPLRMWTFDDATCTAVKPPCKAPSSFVINTAADARGQFHFPSSQDVGVLDHTGHTQFAYRPAKSDRNRTPFRVSPCSTGVCGAAVSDDGIRVVAFDPDGKLVLESDAVAAQGAGITDVSFASAKGRGLLVSVKASDGSNDTRISLVNGL